MLHAPDFRPVLFGELVPALGCTEPIAIALAAAKAKELLGEPVVSGTVICSGNVIKNVKGVVVPNSGGHRGIEVAAALGIAGGESKLGLEVLQPITDEQRENALKLAQSGALKVELEQGKGTLYIKVVLAGANHTSSAEIMKTHANITETMQDGVVTKTEEDSSGAGGSKVDVSALQEQLSVRNIVDFAREVDLANDPDFVAILERQIEYNQAISREGLSGHYGAQVGRTLAEWGDMEKDPHICARACAAAGSDARMSGCSLPVVTNSGSGNQGMTVSLPVIAYFNFYKGKFSREELHRALIVANLVAIHQKRFIGRLSAFCGVVSAAAGAGAGIAFMLGKDYDTICRTIINTIATSGGMVCDGAKSSCASKISVSVENALMGLEMADKGRTFGHGEGIVADDVEQTIRNVGRMAREGMAQTDVEILHIMIGK